MPVPGPGVPVRCDVPGHAGPVFPCASPGLFSLGLAVLGLWQGSVADHSPGAADEALAFEAQFVCAETGLGRDTGPGR